MSKTPRPLNPIELSILGDFNRKPIKRRGEIPDRAGFVLIRSVDHYYQRPFGTLTTRGLVEYFIRCMCGHPCSCDNNGWHITEAGRALLATVKS